jgi:hypothetical protein
MLRPQRIILDLIGNGAKREELAGKIFPDHAWRCGFFLLRTIIHVFLAAGGIFFGMSRGSDNDQAGRYDSCDHSKADDIFFLHTAGF